MRKSACDKRDSSLLDDMASYGASSAPKSQRQTTYLMLAEMTRASIIVPLGAASEMIGYGRSCPRCEDGPMLRKLHGN